MGVLVFYLEISLHLYICLPVEMSLANDSSFEEIDIWDMIVVALNKQSKIDASGCFYVFMVFLFQALSPCDDQYIFMKIPDTNKHVGDVQCAAK